MSRSPPTVLVIVKEDKVERKVERKVEYKEGEKVEYKVQHKPVDELTTNREDDVWTNITIETVNDTIRQCWRTWLRSMSNKATFLEKIGFHLRNGIVGQDRFDLFWSQVLEPLEWNHPIMVREQHRLVVSGSTEDNDDMSFDDLELVVEQTIHDRIRDLEFQAYNAGMQHALEMMENMSDPRLATIQGWYPLLDSLSQWDQLVVEFPTILAKYNGVDHRAPYKLELLVNLGESDIALKLVRSSGNDWNTYLGDCNILQGLFSGAGLLSIPAEQFLLGCLEHVTLNPTGWPITPTKFKGSETIQKFFGGQAFPRRTLATKMFIATNAFCYDNYNIDMLGDMIAAYCSPLAIRRAFLIYDVNYCFYEVSEILLVTRKDIEWAERVTLYQDLFVLPKPPRFGKQPDFMRILPLLSTNEERSAYYDLIAPHQTAIGKPVDFDTFHAILKCYGYGTPLGDLIDTIPLLDVMVKQTTFLPCDVLGVKHNESLGYGGFQFPGMTKKLVTDLVGFVDSGYHKRKIEQSAAILKKVGDHLRDDEQLYRKYERLWVTDVATAIREARPDVIEYIFHKRNPGMVECKSFDDINLWKQFHHLGQFRPWTMRDFSIKHVYDGLEAALSVYRKTLEVLLMIQPPPRSVDEAELQKAFDVPQLCNLFANIRAQDQKVQAKNGSLKKTHYERQSGLRQRITNLCDDCDGGKCAYRVALNGWTLGSIQTPTVLVDTLRDWRRAASIDPFVSIFVREDDKDNKVVEVSQLATDQTDGGITFDEPTRIAYRKLKRRLDQEDSSLHFGDVMIALFWAEKSPAVRAWINQPVDWLHNYCKVENEAKL